MPATEQQITDKSAELETLAATIYANQIIKSAQIVASWNAARMVTAVKITLTDGILNERFLDGQLKYTNDTQRKVALEYAMNTDADYRTYETAARDAEITVSDTQALIKRDESIFEAKRLVLLFYATLP